MRIAIVNWYANRTGGADVYTLFLCRELARLGHEIHFIGYNADPEVHGYATVHLLAQPSLSGWKWRIAAYLQYWHTGKAIAGLSLPKPDVAIISPPFAFKPFRRKFPTVPLIYLPHARIAPIEVEGYLPGAKGGLVRKLGTRLYAKLERRALINAQAVVRFTDSNASLLEEFYRLSLKLKMHVIPIPVEIPPSFTPRPHGGPLRLLSVGRLVESKNLALILSTLAELPAGSPPWRLDIVGDGPERPALERQAHAAALTPSVTFHGQQPNPARFYDQADMFVFPTKLENTGLVMIEALAHGLPVLAIQADGQAYQNSHQELLSEPLQGLLAKHERDFKAKLHYYLHHPEQLTTLSHIARDWACSQYDQAAVVESWQQLLSELAKPIMVLPVGAQL